MLFASLLRLNLAVIFLLTSMEGFPNYVIVLQTCTSGALCSEYRRASRQGRYWKSKKTAVKSGNVLNLN